MRPPQDSPLERAARWSGALAVELAALAAGVARLAAQILEHWPDDRGREWAQRVELVHRALDRDATAADDLAHHVERIAAEQPIGHPDVDLSGPESGAAGFPTGARRRPGPRLGGTEAERVVDELGVRIPQLPDLDERPG